MSANGLTRLPYNGSAISARAIGSFRGPAERISPVCLPSRTIRQLSGRQTGYSSPRWSFVIRLEKIIHEVGGVSRDEE
ncbi:MAG: hypothetical protein WAM09_12785 [Anaerolineales bacterium]